jgi:hypothetical protein
MSTPFERDPVIEAYKKHVDRTLLRANLRKMACPPTTGAATSAQSKSERSYN